MARELSANFGDAIGKRRVEISILAQFLFDTDSINLWTGMGTINWDGKTFTGAANLLGLSQYNETQDLQAQGMTATLQGITTDIIEIALAEHYQGRPCKIWFTLTPPRPGIEDAEGLQELIDAEGRRVLTAEATLELFDLDPYLLFSGFMDVMSISEDGGTATVTVTMENMLIKLARTQESRYTSENQKAKYPDDLGLDFITVLQDKEIIWKSKAAGAG